MNTLMFLSFAVVLAQCVLANNIYEPYTRAKMVYNSNDAIEDSNLGLREKRQATNENEGACSVRGVPGRCVYVIDCDIIRKPNFNVVESARGDPCNRFTDICCPTSEISLVRHQSPGW